MSTFRLLGTMRTACNHGTRQLVVAGSKPIATRPLPNRHHWPESRARGFASPAFGGTSPSNGMFDGLRSRIDDVRQDTEQGREQKAFDAQMKYLSDEERTIDANIYLETIDDLKQAAGLSGFREHLPWVANSPMLSDMKREQQILQTLSDEERRRPGRVTIASKKRIARQVGVDLFEVESLLDRVVGMADVQRWILKRKRQQLTLPNSSTELQHMLTVPGNGFTRSRLYKRRSGFPNPGVKPNRTGKRW